MPPPIGLECKHFKCQTLVGSKDTNIYIEFVHCIHVSLWIGKSIHRVKSGVLIFVVTHLKVSHHIDSAGLDWIVQNCNFAI